MQPLIDDAFHIAESQFRAETPQSLFGGIFKCSDRGARNRVQGIVGFSQAILNRSRKLAIENQELDNSLDCDSVLAFTVHLETADRPQHG